MPFTQSVTTSGIRPIDPVCLFHRRIDSLFTVSFKHNTRQELSFVNGPSSPMCKDLLFEVRYFASGVVVVVFDQIVEIFILRSAAGEIFLESVFEFIGTSNSASPNFSDFQTSHRRASPPLFIASRANP
jgi:hypothetical protein